MTKKDLDYLESLLYRYQYDTLNQLTISEILADLKSRVNERESKKS